MIETVEEEELSRNEFARRAGVHYNTVRLWEKTGKIRVRRVTSNNQEEIRIPVSELTRILAERERGHEAALPDPRRLLSSGRIWEVYETTREENARLRAQVELLREELEARRAELDKLLAALLQRGGESGIVGT